MRYPSLVNTTFAQTIIVGCVPNDGKLLALLCQNYAIFFSLIYSNKNEDTVRLCCPPITFFLVYILLIYYAYINIYKVSILYILLLSFQLLQVEHFHDYSQIDVLFQSKVILVHSRNINFVCY
jgi:hypothetical protein